MTVRANAAFALPRRERGGAFANEMLDLVGLADFGLRYPHEASGGQQQRVASANLLPGVSKTATAGGVRVRTALGWHVLRDPAQTAGATRLSVLIRPEQITLSRIEPGSGIPRQESKDAVTGKVTDIRFHGQDVLVTVDVAGPGWCRPACPVMSCPRLGTRWRWCSAIPSSPGPLRIVPRQTLPSPSSSRAQPRCSGDMLFQALAVRASEPSPAGAGCPLR